MSYEHVHACPKCYRDARCNDDCTREPPYYSRGAATMCRECTGEIDRIDAPHTDGGARALDASEALREARIAGMREALTAMRAILKEDAWGTPYIDLDDAESVLDAAIEAVRRGER